MKDNELKAEPLPMAFEHAGTFWRRNHDGDPQMLGYSSGLWVDTSEARFLAAQASAFHLRTVPKPDENPDPEAVTKEVDRCVGRILQVGEYTSSSYLLLDAARAYVRLREKHHPSSEAPYHPALVRFDTDFMKSWDALQWAKAFNSTARSLGYCEMDEAWLLGWFANAIMRGYDERARQEEGKLNNISDGSFPETVTERPSIEDVRRRVADLEAVERAPDNALTPVGRLDLSIARECLRYMTAENSSVLCDVEGCVEVAEAQQCAEHAPGDDDAIKAAEERGYMRGQRVGARWGIDAAKRDLANQPVEPPLALIDKVIDACNANRHSNSLKIVRYSKTLWAVESQGGGTSQEPTLQSALQKVYDNAVRDLKLRHQSDAESMRELGVDCS